MWQRRGTFPQGFSSSGAPRMTMLVKFTISTEQPIASLPQEISFTNYQTFNYE